METSGLTGAALDWAVAKCEGLNYRLKEKDDLTKQVVTLSPIPCPDNKPGCAVAHYSTTYFSPSTNWAQGGPIIERERMDVWVGCDTDNWCATKANNEDAAEDFVLMQGKTPLIAAMRCYVASKLGASVEIPEELK